MYKSTFRLRTYVEIQIGFACRYIFVFQISTDKTSLAYLVPLYATLIYVVVFVFANGCFRCISKHIKVNEEKHISVQAYQIRFASSFFVQSGSTCFEFCIRSAVFIRNKITLIFFCLKLIVEIFSVAVNIFKK